MMINTGKRKEITTQPLKGQRQNVLFKKTGVRSSGVMTIDLLRGGA